MKWRLKGSGLEKIQELLLPFKHWCCLLVTLLTPSTSKLDHSCDMAAPGHSVGVAGTCIAGEEKAN